MKAAATPRKKLTAKAAQTVVNRYDAAGNGRRMKAWNPPNSGPNKAVTGIENIRKRSSDTVRNDWAGSAGLQHWTTNLIGTGIIPRPKRVKAKKKKQALIDLWDAWCRVCDADGLLTFYAMQTLATRAWLERGEVFIRMRPRRMDSSALEVPFQIQLLEADFVPMLDADTWPNLPQGNRIRSGIELDSRGQRVAYWVYREHPGDNLGTGSIDQSKLIRVLKSQMLHVFEPKRPNQLRGVPDFAAVLAHLRNIMDFADNVLERQKLANLFTVFLKKMAPAFPQDTSDPLTGQPIQQNASGDAAIAMMPGAVVQLEEGEEAQFANPPEPGTMYHEYMRTSHLGTAAGQNLPYEILTGDIKEVSDRTLRIIINEFRRFAEQRQWQVIIPMMCQPVRDYWVDMAVLAGKVATADTVDAKMVEWAPQGWAYIHPVQDVQAKREEVDAGFRSRSSVIAEKGDDPEVVDQERADEQKRAKDMGIETPAANGAAAKDSKKSKSEGDNIAPGEYPRNALIERLHAEKLQAETAVLNATARTAGEPTSMERTFVGLAQLLATQQESNAVLMKAFTDIANALVNRPLVTEVKNEVNPTPVSITNEVNPTPVEITNEIAAPNVTVTNEVNPTPVEVKTENVVNVQPAEVKVELPDRKTTSEITRDNDGNIKRVVQTETNLH